MYSDLGANIAVRGQRHATGPYIVSGPRQGSSRIKFVPRFATFFFQHSEYLFVSLVASACALLLNVVRYVTIVSVARVDWPNSPRSTP